MKLSFTRRRPFKPPEVIQAFGWAGAFLLLGKAAIEWFRLAA